MPKARHCDRKLATVSGTGVLFHYTGPERITVPAVILPDRDREDIGAPEDEHVAHSFIQKRDRKL